MRKPALPTPSLAVFALRLADVAPAFVAVSFVSLIIEIPLGGLLARDSGRPPILADDVALGVSHGDCGRGDVCFALHQLLRCRTRGILSLHLVNALVGRRCSGDKCPAAVVV